MEANNVLEQESIPVTKTAIYVDSGEVGISNTINRAELIGIASALGQSVPT